MIKHNLVKVFKPIEVVVKEGKNTTEEEKRGKYRKTSGVKNTEIWWGGNETGNSSGNCENSNSRATESVKKKIVRKK